MLVENLYSSVFVCGRRVDAVEQRQERLYGREQHGQNGQRRGSTRVSPPPTYSSKTYTSKTAAWRIYPTCHPFLPCPACPDPLGWLHATVPARPRSHPCHLRRVPRTTRVPRLSRDIFLFT
ncbi:unnamed protein product [Pieris brassicae]|uniref:Uncharacterized protein n=1 Tax=Pieris brassicae TaxID=7116 RepID=A0A9P0XID8_PIEBR|nr:unnamed protein product [Pieris brassicae]